MRNFFNLSEVKSCLDALTATDEQAKFPVSMFATENNNVLVISSPVVLENFQSGKVHAHPKALETKRAPLTQSV